MAKTLPIISDGGRTYTVTLRKGLVFSNGEPVVASDFTYTVERAVRIPWGGAGEFITPVIVGAASFAKRKSKTISGISADNASGKIVIHLTAPYGPFDNVLAFPALGIVPAGTPFEVEPTAPPPGVGPYMVNDIAPYQSFSVVKNPRWAAMGIRGIPAGHLDVDVHIQPNLTANALEVLDNTADIFDWSDTVPGGLLSVIRARAAGRFRLVDRGGATYYVFMNVHERPFSSQLAREAVVAGMNEQGLARLGSGALEPACFFLPPAILGHPAHASCPYGRPGVGNVRRARALVERSGMSGQPVAVWSEAAQPMQGWMTYYTQLLNEIGFKAKLKVIANATYFTTIGEERTVHPQTGFAAWLQDFPNPIDFYGVLLGGKAILPTDNENFGEVNDPRINADITKLAPIPTPELDRVVRRWEKLDEYVAKKAYVAVLGYPESPEFASDRIKYGAVVFHPLYGWDLSSLEFK